MAMMLGEAKARITLDIADLMGNADKAEQRMNALDGAAGNAAGGFTKLKNSALGIGTALIAPMGIGLKSAIDLEQGIANLNASLGGVDPSQLDQLSKMITQIGADSKFSATDVAAVADELARSGFTIEEMLGGATKAVVDLSQATGSNLQTAVSGISAAMNIWDPAIVGVETGLTDAAKAADILTVAANQSSADVGDIIAGMRNLGPIAGQMGIGFDEASAAIALMTNYGLKGADAGVSLARGLTNLADPTSEATTALQNLGISAFDMQGNFVGFPSLFNQLNTTMKGLDDQTKLTTLSTIFGAEAADAMALAIAAGEDPLLAIMEAMEGTGQAAEQSALRMDTLGAQFDTLKEGITTFLGSLVQGLIPGMRMLVDAANAVLDVFMKIPTPIKTMIGAVAGSLAAFAAITRAVQGFRALDMLLGGGNAAKFALPVVPMLAFAAAAGIAFAAFKLNIGGIADATADFVDGFKAKWAQLSNRNFISRTLGAIGEGLWRVSLQGTFLGDVAKKLYRYFDRASIAISDFGDFLEDVSHWGDKAGKFLDRLPQPLNRIGSGIGILIQSGRRFLKAFGEDGIQGVIKRMPDELWRLGEGFSRIGQGVQQIIGGVDWSGMAQSVGDVAISIGGWIVSAAVDIGSAVWDWITGTAWPAVSALATPISGAIVSIASWLPEATANLWDAVSSWVTDTAWPAVSSAAVDLAAVIVNIADWTVKTSAHLWGKVWAWVTGTAWPAVSSAAIDLAAVIVNIADWVVNVTGDLWSKVKEKADAAWTALSSGAVNLQEPLHIKVGNFEAEIDLAGMWKAINDSFTTSTTVTEADLAGIELKGQAIGKGAWDALVRGITSIFGGGGGGGGGGAAAFDETGMTGTEALNAQVNAFVEGMFEGLGEGVKETAQQAWDDFWSDFELGFPDIQFGDPEAPIQLELIPMYTELKLVFDGFKKLKKEWDDLDWSFDAPDIDWPDIDISFPGWDDLKALFAEIKAFFDDPWAGINLSIPAPDINWPDMPEPPQWLKNVSDGRLPWDDGDGGFDSGKAADQAGKQVSKTMEAIKLAVQNAGWEGGGGSGNDEPQFGNLDFSKLDTSGLDDLASKSRDVKGAFEELGGAAGPAGTALSTFATNATTAGQAVGVNLTQGLLNALPVFVTALDAFGLNITTASTTMQTSATTAGEQVGLNIAQGALNSLPTFAAGMAGFTTVINTEAGNMGAAGLNAGAAAGFGAANGLASAQGAIAGEIGAWVGLVNGAAGALGAAGFNAGAAAGFGVANGLNSALGAVQAAAAAIADAAAAAMAAALQVASPSKVTRQIGVFFGQGFAMGIGSTSGLVGATAGGLASTASGAMAWSPQARPTYGGGGTVVNGGPVSIAPTINTQTTLSDAQKYQLTQQMAEAWAEATSITYAEAGVDKR